MKSAAPQIRGNAADFIVILACFRSFGNHQPRPGEMWLARGCRGQRRKSNAAWASEPPGNGQLAEPPGRKPSIPIKLTVRAIYLVLEVPYQLSAGTTAVALRIGGPRPASWSC